MLLTLGLTACSAPLSGPRCPDSAVNAGPPIAASARMSLRTFVALAGAAAGLMYVFDPDTGAHRRALMRAQWRGLATFGGTLFAVWGLLQLDDLVEALAALAQR